MTTITTMKATGPVEALSGAVAWKKFIPKNPVMKANGMKKAVMIVSVFMMSFMRLLTTER